LIKLAFSFSFWCYHLFFIDQASGCCQRCPSESVRSIYLIAVCLKSVLSCHTLCMLGQDIISRPGLAVLRQNETQHNWITTVPALNEWLDVTQQFRCSRPLLIDKQNGIQGGGVGTTQQCSSVLSLVN
jgi:hypothetical protein